MRLINGCEMLWGERRGSGSPLEASTECPMPQRNDLSRSDTDCLEIGGARAEDGIFGPVFPLR